MQTAFVVCIAGILLASFVPTFVRELRHSKISEAPENLALLHRRAAAYFAAEYATGAGSVSHCLPPAAGPTPAEPSEEPVEVDWADEDLPGGATWRALGFAPERPVRFAYTFEPTSVGCGLRTPAGTYLVTFRAEGDLDGDGERSLFERRAAVDAEGRLVPIGILYVRDRTE